MRNDMFKVIVERPRRGGKPGEHHIVRQAKKVNIEYDKEDGTYELKERDSFGSGKAKSSTTFRLGWNKKDLNENLTPLWRFIQGNVGRPWDKVYSEICESISVNSTVQKHVLDHLKSMVETNCKIIDGKPHILRRYSHGGYKEVKEEINTFYVHPTTGLLCKSKYQGYKEYRRKNPRQLDRLNLKTIISSIDKHGGVSYKTGAGFHRDETGTWWRIKFVKIEAPFGNLKEEELPEKIKEFPSKVLSRYTRTPFKDAFGVTVNKSFSRDEYNFSYGKNRYEDYLFVTHREQANHKEICDIQDELKDKEKK